MSPRAKEESRAPELSGFLGDAERVGITNPLSVFPKCKASTFDHPLSNTVFSLKEKTLKDFGNQHIILFMLWLRFSSEVHIDPGFTSSYIYISINVALSLSGADSYLKSSWLVCSIREPRGWLDALAGDSPCLAP